MQPDRRDGRDGLRRDRPRDRPRGRRALALRRRRAQPPRLPHLRRPRGGAAPADRSVRRFAREARRGARRRSRTSRASPRSAGTSSICCWSGTSGASRATVLPPEIRSRLATVPAPGALAAAASLANTRDRSPRERVWALVSDPHHLPRWWPRAMRVEDVTQAKRASARGGPRVLGTERGKGVRADYRCTSAAPGERYLVGAGDRGHALRADPALLAAGDPPRRRRGGNRVKLASSERAARALAARLADDAHGDPAAPRRGPGRDRAAAGRDEPGRSATRATSRAHPPMKWWGWGDPERRLELGAGAIAALRSELGEARAGRARVARVGCACPRRGRCRRAIAEAVGEAAVLDSHEHRVRRAAGRGYPDLVRLRAGRLADAPDAVVLPGSADELARVLEVCGREGIAVVPFGGGHERGRAAWSRCAGAFERLITLDLRRLRGVEVDRTSMTATLGPGLRGPEAEEALAARGRHPRPLPAVVRVRDDRRVRGDPLRRAGLERLRALRRARHLAAADRAGGQLSTLETPHTAAGPSLRELALGSEGALGVITRGHRAGCALCPSGAATTRGWRPISHREPTSCALWRSREAFPM